MTRSGLLLATWLCLCACSRSSSSTCPAGMTRLPGGAFKVGEHAESDTVLQPFCIDLTEVTVDAYAACVKSGKCGTDGFGKFTGSACNYGVAGRGDHPMNCVDWAQAVAYCSASGDRLPTEAEWEWAARGQERGTVYPWGNDEPTSQPCWKQSTTCAVGSHPASDAPGGIHDLEGNVSEWTATESRGGSRVYRGGSWGNVDAKLLRATNWNRLSPSVAYDILGFRCAR